MDVRIYKGNSMNIQHLNKIYAIHIGYRTMFIFIFTYTLHDICMYRV